MVKANDRSARNRTESKVEVELSDEGDRQFLIN
jgi:hypothetical protein